MPRRPVRRQITRTSYPVFYIIGEGRKTEPRYFEHVKGLFAKKAFSIKILPKSDDKSSVDALIKKQTQHIPLNQLQKDDQVWLIVDCDTLQDKAKEKLLNWCQKDKRLRLGLTHWLPS